MKLVKYYAWERFFEKHVRLQLGWGACLHRACSQPSLTAACFTACQLTLIASFSPAYSFLACLPTAGG